MKRLALLALVAIIGITVVTQGGAHMVAAPPPPPWVNADGTVNQAHLDDAVPLAGPNGQPLVCGGQVATIRVRDMAIAPTRPGRLPAVAGMPDGATPSVVMTAPRPLRPSCVNGRVAWTAP